jgi:hypothetical protein
MVLTVRLTFTVLSQRRNTGCDSDVSLIAKGEKCFSLASAHFRRVARAVEVDVAFDPADAGLLGAIGIVSEAGGVMELIHQLLGAVLFHGLTPPFDKKGTPGT